MNYAEQAQRLRLYRIIGGSSAALVLALNMLSIYFERGPKTAEKIVFAALAVALASAIYYLPFYLNLTTEEEKRLRWAVKFRWAACGIIAVVGAPFIVGATHRHQLALALLGTVATVTAVNLLVRTQLKKRQKAFRFAPQTYLLTDTALALIWTWWKIESSAFLSLALQWASLFYIVTAEPARAAWARARQRIIVFAVAAAATLALTITAAPDRSLFAACAAVTTCLCAGELLAAFTFDWHVKTRARVVAEIVAFTGEAHERVRRRLLEASSALAANWRRDQPSSPEEIAAWYRRNSCLYIYDLANFHLYGKHIRFTLELLKLARGRVLDYGAGIGDLALELARRGHAVVYFDLEGDARSFAMWRAKGEGLINIDFPAEQRRIGGTFETIYALDVLEHLPDPEETLRFLVSKLAPRGRLILTAPFGATEAHPMHLAPTFDVRRFLDEHGLREAKGWRKWFGPAMIRRRHVLIYQRAN